MNFTNRNQARLILLILELELYRKMANSLVLSLFMSFTCAGIANEEPWTCWYTKILENCEKLRRKIPIITEFIYWKLLTSRNNEYSAEKQRLLFVSLFLKSVQLTPTGAYPIWSILETVYEHIVAKSGRSIGIYIISFYTNIFPLPYTIFFKLNVSF
jgi:hypothetical protein